MEKNKILMIDDEEDFTQLVKLNLEITGRYEVRTENRGAQGCAAALEYRPDLILLDILMPDMEGSEVAYKIKQQEELKDIPIIFLTATAREVEIDSSTGVIGGQVFIAKPVSAEKLMEAIEKHLQQK